MANPSQVEVGQGGATGATASSAVPPSTTFAPEAPAGSSAGAPGSLGAGFKDTAKTATDAIRQQAAQFAGEVGRELGKTGESQKARGVDALKRFARAIDSAARELEPQSAAVAGAVHEAARKVDGLSDNLSNRDVNELIELRPSWLAHSRFCFSAVRSRRDSRLPASSRAVRGRDRGPALNEH